MFVLQETNKNFTAKKMPKSTLPDLPATQLIKISQLEDLEVIRKGGLAGVIERIFNPAVCRRA
jgi:hypothetical protein